MRLEDDSGVKSRMCNALSSLSQDNCLGFGRRSGRARRGRRRSRRLTRRLNAGGGRHTIAAVASIAALARISAIAAAAIPVAVAPVATSAPAATVASIARISGAIAAIAARAGAAPTTVPRLSDIVGRDQRNADDCEKQSHRQSKRAIHSNILSQKFHRDKTTLSPAAYRKPPPLGASLARFSFDSVSAARRPIFACLQFAKSRSCMTRVPPKQVIYRTELNVWAETALPVPGGWGILLPKSAQGLSTRSCVRARWLCHCGAVATTQTMIAQHEAMAYAKDRRSNRAVGDAQEVQPLGR